MVTYIQVSGGYSSGEEFNYTKLPNCDICGKLELKEFVDGRTKSGTWGNLCLSCHQQYGVGLGIGKGQHYQLRIGDA